MWKLWKALIPLTQATVNLIGGEYYCSHNMAEDKQDCMANTVKIVSGF